MDCPEVMGSCCLITEEEVSAAIKGLHILKAASPTDVVSGGLGTRWITDRIDNIVKKDGIPDD